jgi:hypothetical protein
MHESDGPPLALNDFHFVVNRGQWNRAARYLLDRGAVRSWFTDDGVVHELRDRQGNGHVIRQRFSGAHDVRPTGTGRQGGEWNYIRGDGSEPVSGVASYSEVVYDQLYPGVTARYYRLGDALKYDLILAPGVDPSTIRFNYDGADEITIGCDGRLEIGTSVGLLHEDQPLCYQLVHGERQIIPADFIRDEQGIGFSMGVYDPTQLLVIDPTLVYSSYLGGRLGDEGRGVAVDDSGNIYVTGITLSENFPTTFGATKPSLNNDIFVVKLDPTGGRLIYGTYIGGNGDDQAFGLKVAADRTAIVAGTTSTAAPTVNNFPANGIGPSNRTGRDGVLLALKPDGTLKYSLYLGGTGDDGIEDLALDARGNAYVTGWTRSAKYPTTPVTYDVTLSGTEDAFVTKLNPTGDTLIYSTYLGGSGDDRGTGIVVDPGGAAHVTGWTASSNFQTTANAFSSSNQGGRDAFVVRLRHIPELFQLNLEYSTLIGGVNNDQPNAIALDLSAAPSYLPVITGVTLSDDYPHNPGDQGRWFITKFGSTASNYAYSRLFGVTGDTVGGMTVQVDGRGSPYVCGATSFASSFNTTLDAYRNSPRGGKDIALLKLSPDGQTLQHGSVIGGSNDDLPWHSSYLGQHGDLLVTGVTRSHDFPVIRGAFDRRLNDTGESGQSDAFIMRFSFDQRPYIAGPVVHNFDTLRCDSTRLDTFYIHNIGEADLVIKSNIFQNGTTRFKLESPGGVSPITIRPGDSLPYIVRYTAAASNSETNTLLIEHNDSIRGKNPFRIILTAIRIDPGLRGDSVVTFRNIAACGEADTSFINIENIGNSNVFITSIEFADSSNFSIPLKLLFPKPVNVSSGITIPVRFQPNHAGPFRDTIIVHIAECDRPLRILLQGMADSIGYSIKEGDLEFPEVPPCADFSDTTITITNTGTAPITIDFKSITGSQVFEVVDQLPLTIPKGESRQLRIRFRPAIAGSVGATMTLISSPCALLGSTKLHGKALANDSIRASAGDIDFGTISSCVGQLVFADTTITLSNHGLEGVTFDPPLLSAPFAINSPGLFPAVVVPGDSVRVVIRYAPAASGRDSTVALFPFRDGGCDDTVRITLKGRREEIVLEPSADNIEITDLSGCEQYRDTTIHLFNRSSVPITVDSAVATIGAELRPSASFTVPAGGSVSVILRFRPQQAGEATESVTLYLGPCDDSLTIVLHGRKQGVVLGFNEQEIVFPTRLSCTLPATFDTTATLHNNGNSPTDATIISASIIGDPSFSIPENIIGRSVASLATIPVPVRIAPGGAGNYSGTLELILAPCNDTLRLSLAGSVIDAKLVAKGGDFGAVRIGTTGQTALVLHNPLPLPVHIDSIEALVAPFKLVTSTPPLPADLAPGDSLVLELEFAPAVVGNFQQITGASISSPCAFTVNLPLTGIATPDAVDTVIFCIEERSSGLVGDTVVVPVRTPTLRTFPSPTQIDYYIHYNASRLQLLFDQQIESFQIISDDPVDSILHLRQSGVTALQLQQLRLRFRLLLGPDGNAGVRLDSVVISSVDVAATVCADSAAIHITSRCLFMSFTFGKYRNLLGEATPNPAVTAVEVTYQQLEDARAILRVWDMNGREVLRPLDEDLPGGRYTVRFNVSDLPSGRYLYSIDAGMYREVKGMVIQR